MSDTTPENQTSAVSAAPPCSLTCPQCETPLTDVDELNRNEGVCESCCEQNQAELDEHNCQSDWWNSMSDDERDAVIRFAIK